MNAPPTASCIGADDRIGTRPHDDAMSLCAPCLCASVVINRDR